MKKLFAFLLAAVLLFSCALAENNTGVTELTWKDVKKQAKKLGGETIRVEDPACIVWLPASFEVWVPEEPEAEAEDVSVDTSFRLIAKDEKYSGIEISLRRTDMEVYRNAKDDIKARILPVSPDLKEYRLNGWPALIYSRKIADDDYRVFALIWDEAYPVSITAMSETPIKGKAFRKLFEIFCASYRKK